MDTDQLQRLDQFLSDPKIPQEEKNRAVAMARTAESSDTPLSRAGNYVTGQANRFASSAQNLFADITGQAQPAGRTWGDVGSDALTVGGPVIAPGLTAAGIGVGAGARALGADQETADLANAGTQLVGGAGNALYQGGKAALGAKAAASGLYKGITKAATDAGYSIPGGGGLGADLLTDLQHASASPLARPKDVKAMAPLMQKLRSLTVGGQTYGMGSGATYADLEDTMNAMGPGWARGQIKKAMMQMLSGTEEGAARQAADVQWGRVANPLLKNKYAAGAGIGGAAGLASYQLAGGHWKRALGTAGAVGLGLASRGALTAGMGAAAGPLARGLVGAASARQGALADEGPTPDAVSPETAPEPDTAPEPTAPAQQPAPARQVVQGRFGREIGAVADLVGIPAPVMQAFMGQESGGKTDALSHPAPDQVQTPAHGLMQITSGTFDGVKGQVRALLGRPASVDNPLDNLIAGGVLLRKYLDKTNGDVEMAARLYHGGENPAAWGPRTHQYGQDIVNRLANR